MGRAPVVECRTGGKHKSHGHRETKRTKVSDLSDREI